MGTGWVFGGGGAEEDTSRRECMEESRSLDEDKINKTKSKCYYDDTTEYSDMAVTTETISLPEL